MVYFFATTHKKMPPSTNAMPNQVSAQLFSQRFLRCNDDEVFTFLYYFTLCQPLTQNGE